MEGNDSTVGTSVPPKLDKDADSDRIHIVVPKTLLNRVDEWRGAQRPIPTRSEAIRALVEKALDD